MSESSTTTPANTDSLASRMKAADWWHAYSDDIKKRDAGAEEIRKIEKDLERLAGQDKAAAAALWNEHAPKAYQVPAYLRGAEATRDTGHEVPAGDTKAKSTQYEIEPDRLAKLQELRHADSSRAAQSMGLNSVEALPSRERTPDTPELAVARSLAKAQLDPTDTQLRDKSKAIDAMQGSELAALSAATGPKQAEKVFEQARNRIEHSSAEVEPRKANPPLEERFNVRSHLLSKDYEFRDQPGKVAFTERLTSLRTADHSQAAAVGMMDRAAERGWATVRLTGSPEFVRQAWIAAEARGIKAVGYEPTKGDRDAAAAERARMEASALARTGAGPRSQEPAADRIQAPSQDNTVAVKELRKDREETSPAQIQSSSTTNVLRALDLVMQKQGIREPQQEAIRQELGKQLDAMQANGRTPIVKVYDRDAPRAQDRPAAIQAPRQVTSERTR